MFLQLDRIGLAGNRNNDATFLHYTVRSRQSIAAHGIENDIDILNYILRSSATAGGSELSSRELITNNLFIFLVGGKLQSFIRPYSSLPLHAPSAR